MATQQSPNQQDALKGSDATGPTSTSFNGNLPTPELANTQAASANPALTDLFFYNQSVGRGEFYGTDGLGNINHLSTYSALPKSLTQILSGMFSFGSPCEGMLMYDNAQGAGAFYTAGRDGTLNLVSFLGGWRKSWTHIIKGHFVDNGSAESGFDSIIFYEGSTGESALYCTDGEGHIQLVKLNNWSPNWTKIVPGPFTFGTPLTGLFFYDQPHGSGAFYSTDGSGNFSLLAGHAGLRTTWTTIITTPFGLLFYDAGSGVSEFYSTDGEGGLSLLKNDTWSKGWTHIISSSNFVFGSPTGGLLFYNSTTGASEFYRYDDAVGNISLIRSDTWSKGWTHILENATIQ